MSKALLLGPRAGQLLSAAVVLGLSANLYGTVDILRQICDALNNGCSLMGLQPAVGFCAFVGAWGLIDALVGAAAVFLDVVPWIVTVGADGLAGVFYLAGGVRLAVLLGTGRCPPGESYCHQLKADSAFLFFGLLITLAVVGISFFKQRGAPKHSAV